MNGYAYGSSSVVWVCIECMIAGVKYWVLRRRRRTKMEECKNEKKKKKKGII